MAIGRREFARTLSMWLERSERFTFVGNGYLAREMVAVRDRPTQLCLFGGMGLALPTALGFVSGARSERSVVVVEGDGNFLMGLSAGLLCGRIEARIVHIVYANGVYESSGSQPLPVGSAFDPLAVALGFGYSSAAVAASADELVSRLVELSNLDGAHLIWVAGEPGDPPAPRPAQPFHVMVDRYIAAAR